MEKTFAPGTDFSSAAPILPGVRREGPLVPTLRRVVKERDATETSPRPVEGDHVLRSQDSNRRPFG